MQYLSVLTRTLNPHPATRINRPWRTGEAAEFRLDPHCALRLQAVNHAER